MKKLIYALTLSLGLSLTTTSAYSQSINGQLIKDIEVEYMRIVGTSGLLSSKVTVEVDFGQEWKYFKNNDNQVKDAEGKPVKFNSMIDALNFFSNNGYEFVTAYVLTVSNQNVYHYLMKKRR